MRFLPAIEGQELARTYFHRALQRGRVSHSYLFLGPDGAGKRRFAHELAKALFCETRDACGSCLECLRVEHGNNPLVAVHGPAEGKSVIDIDTVRALCTRAQYKSDHTKIAVLEQAELLSEPAANALLKTLEEPPGDFIVVLTAQSTGSLLPTIVSRCHRVYFPAGGDGCTPAEDALEAAVEDARHPEFLARTDIKQWLRNAVGKDIGTVRGQVRSLLDFVIRRGRARLAGASGSDLDRWLRGLEALLGWREDLDRNVSPDLVLEKVITWIRWAG